MQTYANFCAWKTMDGECVENLWILKEIGLPNKGDHLREESRIECFNCREASSAFTGGISLAELLAGLSALAFTVWSKTITKISATKTNRLVLFFILTGFRVAVRGHCGKPLTQIRKDYFKTKGLQPLFDGGFNGSSESITYTFYLAKYRGRMIPFPGWEWIRWWRWIRSWKSDYLD